MTGNLEREVKLDADPDLELPDLSGAVAGLWAVARPTLDLDATYFDAQDVRLLAAGVTVRRRTGEGTRWTVKLPEGGGATPPATARSAAAGVARREIDLFEAGTQVPDQVRAYVAPWLGDAPLVAVARLESHRRRLALGPDPTGDHAVAELDDDLVVVHVGEAGPPAARFREIEVEQAGQDPAASATVVDAVVARLLSAGARPAPASSKLARALELVGRG